MFIPLGEIGLGNLSLKDKKLFISYLKKQMSEDEKIEPITEAQIVRNGLGWDKVSHAADVMQIIGFIYLVGSGTPKKLRDFFDLAKKWAKTKRIDYDEEEISKFIEFMEKNK